MKIRVLGCSGAEFPGHNPPGFLLDNEILFDAGSVSNVLNGKEQQKIKHIFVTHAHLDHIRGIPFLADNLLVRDGTHKVNVISIPQVIRTIRTNLLNGRVWPDFTMIPRPKRGVLRFHGLRHGRSVKVNGYRVTPLKVNHSVPAVGYLVEHGTKRFFYTGDTGPTPGTWKYIGDRPLDCLVIEVSFPNRMRARALMTGHLTPRLLRDELSRLQLMPSRIFVTHPKPEYLKAIKKELRDLGLRNLRLLRDGQTFIV